MKEKIVYFGAFILAFILVTGALIYMNSMYKNIFRFDFTSDVQAENVTAAKPAAPEPTTPPKDTSAVKKTPTDSLKLNQPSMLKDSSAVSLSDTNSMKKVKDKIAEVKKVDEQYANSAQKQNNAALEKINSFKRDSTYHNWVKNTAKIYTSMDTKKAAKIILSYSDNIARDILLTMKKKKAADILAEFKPEVATRIITATQ